MDTLIGMFCICLSYIFTLFIPLLIAPASLFLHDLQSGSDGNIVRKFREQLSGISQYIVNNYLSNRSKYMEGKGVHVFFAHLARVSMSLFYMAIIVGFAFETLILLERKSEIWSISTALVTILSTWHLISAWRFGQKMLVLHRKKE